jgi:hypothetical protein
LSFPWDLASIQESIYSVSKAFLRVERSQKCIQVKIVPLYKKKSKQKGKNICYPIKFQTTKKIALLLCARLFGELSQTTHNFNFLLPIP